MATKDEIAEIKSRLDITEIVSEHVNLKQTGKNWLGLCPFHNEKTPSFNVSPDLGIYKCFGCGRSGDVIKFIQEVEHLEFPEAIDKLARRAGVTLSSSGDDKQFKEYKEAQRVHTETAKLFHHLLIKHGAGKGAKQYVQQKRGYTAKILKQFNIGFAPYKYDFILKYLQKMKVDQQTAVKYGLAVEGPRGIRDKFINRIMFPIHNTSGQVVGFSGRVFAPDDERPKYLNSPETVVFHKRKNLFGLFQAKDAITKADKVIIVEGQTDVISSHQAGIKNIVAPLGTGLTNEQLQLLARFSKNIVLATDNDEAGVKAAIRGALLITELGYTPYLLSLPTQFHDVDELIKQDKSQWEKLANSDTTEFIEWLISLYHTKEKELSEHISIVFPNKESILRQIMQFIERTTDEVKKKIYREKVEEKLGWTYQDMSAMATSAEKDEEIQHLLRSATNREEYLVNCVLTTPRYITLRQGIWKFVNNKNYRQLLEQIYAWQTDDKEGEWTEVNQEKKPSFSDLIAYLTEKYPALQQIVTDFGILKGQQFSDEEYKDLCSRLIEDKTRQQIAVAKTQLHEAEMQKDKKLVKELTDRIHQLSQLMQKTTR